MNRRDWMLGTATLGLLTELGLFSATAGTKERQEGRSTEHRLITTRRSGDNYEAVLLEPDGAIVTTRQLPDRGHSFAISASRRNIVVFGRQPGFYAYVLEPGTLAVRQKITPAENRHFFGHGAFSADDQHFYTTENDYGQGRGIIGVYALDANGRFNRVDEWPAHGIGSHEIVLGADGKTLCVANGGLLTHPDYGKHPLNLADMRPSLVYLDLKTGALQEQVFLPEQWHKLSIRHLALDVKGRTWIGCQYMGSRSHDVPVVGVHARGAELKMLWGPDKIRHQMQHYVGSMAASSDGCLIASSSPVGGTVVIWDARALTVRTCTPYADACGIAALGPDSFLASSGNGEMQRIELSGPAPLRHAVNTAWDNHMRVL
jgi:hypothetical protein